MFLRILSLCLVCSCLYANSFADNLYRLWISSPEQAEMANRLALEPIISLSDSYLVLGDADEIGKLPGAGLRLELIAENVDRDHLALDNRHDRENTKIMTPLFEQDGLRLYKIADKKALESSDGSTLIPIRNDNLRIEYRESFQFHEFDMANAEDLGTLIAKIRQDSLESYLETLQAFNGRVAGTASNRAARDWIRAKLQSFGYGSVSLDPFSAYVSPSWVTCYNVICTKTGTVWPDRQIVIGAHFDAVPGSPGADDNGTGTAAVLEIARALSDVPTDMTIIFALFDSEEQGLNGSWHYSDNAFASGDDIVCMLNMDMLGFYPNDNRAEIYYGDVDAYANLWMQLAQPLVGIEGIRGGSAANSDHYPFTQNGYDAMFSIEYQFSNVYHSPQDSTTYINYDYFARMARATLATAYVVDLAPLGVEITAIRDGGDGQSLQVSWQALDPFDVDHYKIYFDTDPSSGLDSITIPAGQTMALLTGLTEGEEYFTTVVAFDADGNNSVVNEIASGIPLTLPALPGSVVALPEYRGIKVSWKGNNTELDFDHYSLVRDGVVLPVAVTDTFYLDNDFTLGEDVHAYIAVAVDADGNISDTTGAVSAFMRAATFEPGRILAVNRSGMQSSLIVDETVTGEYLRDALDGYNFDYFSDTAYASSNRTDTLNLIDLLSYELVIIGGEAGRNDDLGTDPVYGGILDTLDYYLSVGGKAIIFGRWGELYTSGNPTHLITFNPGSADYGYNSYFHITQRTQYLSSFTTTLLQSDLIGAHSQAVGYPDLSWDSLATVGHSAPWVEASGIPCPTYLTLQAAPEVIYTYDSRGNQPISEGKPVAWRYLGPDYSYVFFEFPLSFMERSTAKAALQMAISELITPSATADVAIDPDLIDIPAGPPATITLYLGNFTGGYAADDVDLSSIVVNGSLLPSSATVVLSHPDFTGEVVQVEVDGDDFIASYGTLTDTLSSIYTISWEFNGTGVVHYLNGPIDLIPEMPSYVAGDANGDLTVNVGDAVFIVNYVFKGGSAPVPLEAADANCDLVVNVGDAVYIVNYVFKGGSAPGCN